MVLENSSKSIEELKNEILNNEKLLHDMNKELATFKNIFCNLEELLNK